MPADKYHLNQLEERTRKWESLLFPVFLCSCAILFGVWFWIFPLGKVHPLGIEPNPYIRIGVLLTQVAIPLALLQPLFQILMAIDLQVKKYWVKGYYIEEQEKALLVHGSVTFVHMDYVREELKRLRPDFEVLPLEDSFREFGCTLAAVQKSSQQHRT